MTDPTVGAAKSAVLKVSGLAAAIGGSAILRGIDLEVLPGEVHAIMGPNGSGKSTLAGVLAGRGDIEVTGGEARLQGADLLAMAPEERAAAGLFLAFQYPVAIPGVSVSSFLKEALNAVRKARGLKPLDALRFLERLERARSVVDVPKELLARPLNDGFSGGEKKKTEVFQMALLEPTLAVLDETDSGLDIDALRIVAEGVNRLRGPERALLVITHYQRLLDHVRPDRVHVMVGGRIVRSGPPELALELEERGYEELVRELQEVG